MLLGTSGCATRDSVENLEKRVTALEQKQQAKESESKDRQSKLEQNSVSLQMLMRLTGVTFA
jgi:ribosomal protein L9